MTPQELKDCIVYLAIQGKLVEQRPEEGTGEEAMTKAITTVKSKKAVFSDDDYSLDLPDSWAWAKLSELTSDSTLNDGNWVLSNDMVPSGPVKLIQLGSIGNCIYKDKGFKYLTEKRFRELNGRQIHEGYLLVNRLIGDRMLACILPSIDGILITAVDVCWIAPNEQLFNQKYLMYALTSEDFQRKVKALGRGTTRFRISKLNLIDIAFPFPPLAEQKRIVAKIEELLPLIDRYDQAYSKLEKLNKRFPLDLQKSILQLAMQGKLVPQDPSEGTGEELYRQIQAEKGKLVKEGKIKKEKPLAEISEDEIPFEIPDSWEWVRWGELSQDIQYGFNAPAQTNGRIKMVRISDIQDSKVLWDTVPYCEISEKEISAYLLKKNDILFARTGGTVGKSYLVEDVPEDAVYAGYLIRTRYSTFLFPKYLKYFMESNLYWNQLRDGTIATAQPNCNGKTLSRMILPLPPLAEQKRIVEAIERLFPLCEKLKRIKC
ncbi:MAG: restriction endonuclease subunit S [Clostridia bacterium]|nr:restriction endonuclease subunit S [Clostridia bacterium]